MARIALVPVHALTRCRERRPILRGTICHLPSHFRPQIGRDYPLNLSISLSGGKETNKDSLSNGE